MKHVESLSLYSRARLTCVKGEVQNLSFKNNPNNARNVSETYLVYATDDGVLPENNFVGGPVT